MIALRLGLGSWCLAWLALVGCGAAAQNQNFVGVDCGAQRAGAAECEEQASAAHGGANSAGAETQPGAGTASSKDKAQNGKSGALGLSGENPGSRTGEPGATEEGPARPVHEPGRVREALDATATAPDERSRLGLRLAIVNQGPDAPWLIAIANRGTEPVRVNPDLRTLSLEITPKPPEPPSSETNKRARPVKAPKPITCALPRDLFPSTEDPSLRLQLEPGEAVVDSFDPRLYCLRLGAASPLKPGAQVVARLGWPEKTKTVWKKGKSEKVLVAQVPPFIAEKVSGGSDTEGLHAPRNQTEPSAAKTESVKTESASADNPEQSSFLKQLVSTPIELGAEHTEVPAEADREPLALQLTRGSDARTERDATLTVSIVNRSKAAQRVFFRRELLTFEISGPRGLISCEPGPDNRAPDRRAFQTLRPGGRISATSRLVEMCPAGSMRSPGLYLVHARFDATGEESAEGSQPAYHGRLLSQKPASVRVRKGWGVLPPQHQPTKVRLGAP